MNNLKLGLSGCKLEILPNNIVRKYSKDLDYNCRLLSQANKQSNFSNTFNGKLISPKVLNLHQEDLYYFDMEYCTGKNYDKFFNECSLQDSKYVLDILFSYLDYLIDNSETLKDEIVKEKIICKLSSLIDKSRYKNVIKLIIEEYDDLKIKNIKKSFCHGDLTFANILFSKDKIYFIDFLDSFIDSYYIDFAKLKQDLYHHWVLKVNNESSLRILQIFSFYWYNICEKYQEIITSEAFELFDFINLLRIEPYVKDENLQTLISCIENHKYYVNFNNSNGRSILQVS